MDIERPVNSTEGHTRTGVGGDTRMKQFTARQAVSVSWRLTQLRRKVIYGKNMKTSFFNRMTFSELKNPICDKNWNKVTDVHLVNTRGDLKHGYINVHSNIYDV